jgi:hypothetical protein
MLGLRYTYKSCARRNTTFTFLDQFYNVPFHYEALHFGRSSLAPSRRRGRAVRLVDRFGFSWLVAVSLRRPPIMRFGFPWISLDSLVRIEAYQWVTRHQTGTDFRGAFRGVERAGTGAGASCGLGLAEGKDCS